MTRFSAPLALCLALCSVVSAQTDIDFLSESANATESGCTGTDFLSTMCLETIDHHPMGVLLEIFLFVMAFLALAIVCDDYLVLSLETLCVRWSIRDDIAGCTFMAFGSAAPEIIVNAVATIKSGGGGSSAEGSTDQGISAILGSGMIAFMLIPGFCGIFGGKDKPLQLKRRPLLRDVTAYSIGLVEVCVFFRDHYISTAEALIMLLTYASYILVVVFSPRIRKALRRGSKGEMIPLLEEDASARTVRGLNVRFFCKAGDSIDFPAEGPLLTRNGEAVPATEAGLKFLLSSEFQIQYPDSEKVMQTRVGPPGV